MIDEATPASWQQSPAVPDASTAMDSYRVRFLEQLLTEALPSYWHRRAEQLEAARPRRGDFHGRATRAELRARYDRLTEDAARCRQHAQLVASASPDGLDRDLIFAVLAELLGVAP